MTISGNKFFRGLIDEAVGLWKMHAALGHAGVKAEASLPHWGLDILPARDSLIFAGLTVLLQLDLAHGKRHQGARPDSL